MNRTGLLPSASGSLPVWPGTADTDTVRVIDAFAAPSWPAFLNGSTAAGARRDGRDAPRFIVGWATQPSKGGGFAGFVWGIDHRQQALGITQIALGHR